MYVLYYLCEYNILRHSYTTIIDRGMVIWGMSNKVYILTVWKFSLQLLDCLNQTARSQSRKGFQLLQANRISHGSSKGLRTLFYTPAIWKTFHQENGTSDSKIIYHYKSKIDHLIYFVYLIMSFTFFHPAIIISFRFIKRTFWPFSSFRPQAFPYLSSVPHSFFI